MYVFDAANDCAPVAGAQGVHLARERRQRLLDVAQNGTRGETWLRGYQLTDAEGKVMLQDDLAQYTAARDPHPHPLQGAGVRARVHVAAVLHRRAERDRVRPRRVRARRRRPTRPTGPTTSTAPDGDSLLLRPAADGARGYAPTCPSACPAAAARARRRRRRRHDDGRPPRCAPRRCGQRAGGGASDAASARPDASADRAADARRAHARPRDAHAAAPAPSGSRDRRGREGGRRPPTLELSDAAGNTRNRRSASRAAGRRTDSSPAAWRSLILSPSWDVALDRAAS